MKHRKHILMLLTLMGLFISFSVTLYAQQNPPKPPAGTDGVKNMIISGALNTGRMHRFVEQCGASPELLAKYVIWESIFKLNLIRDAKKGKMSIQKFLRKATKIRFVIKRLK